MTSEDSPCTQSPAPYFLELIPFVARPGNPFETLFYSCRNGFEEGVTYTACTNSKPVQPRGTRGPFFKKLRYDLSAPLISHGKSDFAFAAVIAHYRANLRQEAPRLTENQAALKRTLGLSDAELRAIEAVPLKSARLSY